MRLETNSGSPKPPLRAAKHSRQRSTAPDRYASNGRLETTRLLYVAIETGARFVRERISVDPLEWLLTRRDLFEGRTAADACRFEDGFRRAIVVHGLSLELDAPPCVVDGIPSLEFLSSSARTHLAPGLPRFFDKAEPWPQGPLALYTCSISAELTDEHVQVFCAMIARNPGEVRGRLRQRYGVLLEDEAKVRLGFDWSEPLACAMVSEAMAHVLTLAAGDPTSPIANGLDFQVEQRFAS